MKNFIDSTRLKRRVLIVDDEKEKRERLKEILKVKYDISFAGDGKEAYEIVKAKKDNISLILTDLNMPVMDGFGLLDAMKKDDLLKKIPVIVITPERESEVRSIELGAADFLSNPYEMPEVLVARSARVIELFEDKNIISHTERDDLTNLFSKEFFCEYIRQIESRGVKENVDVAFINIEKFHLVNEIHGKQMGDIVLKRLGDALHLTMKKIKGIACRHEADLFYAYFKHNTDLESIIKSIEDEVNEVIPEHNIKIRAGIYQFADKNIEVEDRFDRAKLACDRIRGDYTKQIAYYNSDMHQKIIYNQRLINDIDSAIANKNLMVYYQPKYSIEGDKPKLKSAEALVRWMHPKFGMISPGDFIPLFESNGLIQKLDRFVWKEAAAQINKWKKEYDVTVPVSVNVSRIDIYDPELESEIMSVVNDNGLSNDELMLEITESAYADNASGLVEVVEHLRSKGFKIEMDDFGSGYSSLNMLTTLPIDVLKLDMKFIRNMQKDEKSLKLVELIIDISDFLNVPVVAEGVEDEEQLMILKKMGCEIIQGYFFSRPVPAKEFNAFIERDKMGMGA
ncbi:MAG: EAL domain-containing protein [Lachnospiraceae bacterium]|nr:EAL domain-containing protein [Lachnospiraceae bacterium]